MRQMIAESPIIVTGVNYPRWRRSGVTPAHSDGRAVEHENTARALSRAAHYMASELGLEELPEWMK
jgi:hypothetical protein